MTALDISPVALAKASAHAAERGVEIATVQHDLLSGEPLPGTYDLVSAQFWHPPLDRVTDFHDVLGAAVRPGGTLLVVGHHPDSLGEGQADPHGHARFLFTPEKVAALFPTNDWDLRVCASPTRPTNRPDGPALLTDSVVLLVRR